MAAISRMRFGGVQVDPGQFDAEAGVWRYGAHLRLCPMVSDHGEERQPRALEQAILDDEGVPTAVHTEIELAGTVDTEPPTADLGTAILQWLGGELAAAREAWTGKQFVAGLEDVA